MSPLQQLSFPYRISTLFIVCRCADTRKGGCRGFFASAVDLHYRTDYLLYYYDEKIMCYIERKLPRRVAPLTHSTHKLTESIQANVWHLARVNFWHKGTNK